MIFHVRSTDNCGLLTAKNFFTVYNMHIAKEVEHAAICDFKH